MDMALAIPLLTHDHPHIWVKLGLNVLDVIMTLTRGRFENAPGYSQVSLIQTQTQPPDSRPAKDKRALCPRTKLQMPVLVPRDQTRPVPLLRLVGGVARQRQFTISLLPTKNPHPSLHPGRRILANRVHHPRRGDQRRLPTRQPQPIAVQPPRVAPIVALASPSFRQRNPAV
jgi:hypothetical protein